MSRRTIEPRVSVAGRVDPADLATAALYLVREGFPAHNKSDLVYYTFQFMAAIARQQHPDMKEEKYYHDHFSTLAELDIKFKSRRDRLDKIKALVRDSLEEFSLDEQEEVLEYMVDMRTKGVTKGEVDEPSIDELLNELNEDD